MADHTRRLLVFSYPPPRLLNRAVIGADNLWRRLRGNSFRAFTHPPQDMMRVLHDAGLRTSYEHHGRIWTVAGLERT